MTRDTDTIYSVTYADHFTGSSPDWTVDPNWLQRVSDVVDMVTSRGLHAITNVHHGKSPICISDTDDVDATMWADITAADANITQIEERFYGLWYQIGTKLACKSNMVAFEPLNECPCDDASDGDTVNRLNDLFLKALNDAGGFNPKRVVTLVGCAEDSIKTSEWFEAPTGYPNPWGIQFHYYSPCKSALNIPRPY